MRFAFVTATPLNIRKGSGTYAGLAALASGLRHLGAQIDIITPGFECPIFTLRRWGFNQMLRWREWAGWDFVVGVDADGYTIAGKGHSRHIASIKGVVADEMRFERGLTRWTMGIQARWEKAHVHRAHLVVTTSEYAAGKIQALYGLAVRPRIVPEAVEVERWKELLNRAGGERPAGKFRVLTVCRFYPRKKLDVLLRAVARVREKIPGLEARIVGNGPERERLLKLWRQFGLEGTVRWLGDITQEELAREYRTCDVFCLPSVQEGFGIVFLEAMLAGKPIVAARAGAAPEVVKSGLLAKPDDDVSLGEALVRLYHQPELRRQLGAMGEELVRAYDAPVVARQFLAVLREAFWPVSAEPGEEQRMGRL